MDVWVNKTKVALDKAHRFMDTVYFENAPRTAYHIAGGFPRDSFYCRPWKDIDIVVEAPEGQLTPTSPDGTEYAGDIWNVQEFTFEGEQMNTFNMAHGIGLHGVLDRIDLGICQIGVDADDAFTVTDAFRTDFLLSAITIMRETRQGHIDRVAAKFPSHTVIDPNDFMPKAEEVFELE